MNNQDPAVTYGSYLEVDRLLDLQRPRSEGPEHDEILFIVIHQVYELWFKELLHEFDRVMDLMRSDQGAKAQHTLKRIRRPAAKLGVIMVIAVSCVKLLSAHNSTQHTSRKHKV